MDPAPGSSQRLGLAARTGAAGAVVAAFAFFDGVFVGMPIAALAASFGPVVVLGAGAVAVSFLSIACCRWVDRRWDEWCSAHGERIEKRLEKMRDSRLMRRPVTWIEGSWDR